MLNVFLLCLLSFLLGANIMGGVELWLHGEYGTPKFKSYRNWAFFNAFLIALRIAMALV